ncbi:MAG: hypothetical protein JSU88_05260 [Nitrospinaceae bacterium]|nr:MAG: hypothetical protein JSU88_05260 [Nitrospinaceae bacterium]
MREKSFNFFYFQDKPLRAWRNFCFKTLTQLKDNPFEYKPLSPKRV